MSKQLNDKVFDFILGEAMEKYAKDIADEDVSCEMSEEEKADMEQQKSRIYKKVLAQASAGAAPRRKIRRKRVIILAAALIMLLALGLNASAFRVFIFKTYTNMVGTILKIDTSDAERKKYEEIKEFEAIDELIVPGWLPSGMQLTKITDDLSSVTLEYEGNGKWLNFTQEPLLQVGSSIQTENNDYNIEKYKILGMKAQIIEIKSETDFTLNTVIWNSDDIQYTLDTNIGKKELKTILAGLQYYKQ